MGTFFTDPLSVDSKSNHPSVTGKFSFGTLRQCYIESMSDRLASVYDALFFAAQQVRNLPAACTSDDLALAMKGVAGVLEDLSSIRTYMRSSEWPPDRERFLVLAQSSLIALRRPGPVDRFRGRKGPVELSAVTDFAHNVVSSHRGWSRTSISEVGRMVAVKAQVSVLRHALVELRTRSHDDSVHYSVHEHLEALSSQDRRSAVCIEHARKTVSDESENVLPLLVDVLNTLAALGEVDPKKTREVREAREEVQRAATVLLEMVDPEN